MGGRVRIHLLSTAVAPLGSGLGGGVEQMIINAARQLDTLGYEVRVIAPAGSVAEVPILHTLPGRLAPTAVALARDAPPVIAVDSFLAAALRELQIGLDPKDVILNFSYDWLPLFVSGLLPCPLGTLVSMGSLNDFLDQEIRHIALRHPERIAWLSAAQAASFGLRDAPRLIPPGLDLTRYRYNVHPRRALCWLGRIAPEKGLDDVFTLATRTGQTVTLFGPMQDPAYWETLHCRHPDAPINYGGFLDTSTLAETVGDFQALLMTPKWLEAFGIVGIEALACGTPVLAYRNGGIQDYVRDGETGWLVQPGDVDALCAAAARIAYLDRAACRALVEKRYTLAQYGRALVNWLHALAEAPMDPSGVTA